MMGEHTIKVTLDDLQIIRIGCPRCQALTEIPVERLAEAREGNLACSICGEIIEAQASPYKPLQDLALAFRAFRSRGITIEFSVSVAGS